MWLKMHGAIPPLPDKSSNLVYSSKRTKMLHPKTVAKQGNCELTHITQRIILLIQQQ